MRFFGNSLPERLRSTTLALLGVVAAACLVIVGLTLQQGLPLADSGPIHDPVESRVGPAQALVERVPQGRNRAASAPAATEPPPRSAPPPTEDRAPAPTAAAPTATPVEETPAPVENDGDDAGRRSPAKASPEPTPAPVPVPAEEPVATPSSEPPEPAPEAPVEEPSPVPGKGHAYGKGGGGGPAGTGPPGLARK